MAAASPRVRKRPCRGVALDDVITLVERSIPREGWGVYETIIDQMGEFANRSAYPHGFAVWIGGLQAGWADLPETIPLSVLLAWRDGYTHHPAGAAPLPLRRCEDCRMALPNCAGDGFGTCLSPCPVCGSSRIWHASLTKLGTFING